MTELCKLAAKHGTDKFGAYTRLYSSLFEDKRFEFKHVMEIGIGTKQAMSHVPNYAPGASLRMWRDYFPNATILGCDIDESVLFSEPNIDCIRLDQSNSNDLAKAASWNGNDKWDLIIDDGSHIPEHQVLSAKALMPHIRSGGYYIIEDVNEFSTVSPHLSHEHSMVSYKYTDALIGRCIVIRKEESTKE